MISKILLTLRIIINILIVPMTIIVTGVIANNICELCFECNLCLFYIFMWVGIVLGIPIYWLAKYDDDYEPGYEILWIPTILISLFGVPIAVLSIKLICIIMWNFFVDIGNALTPIIEKIFIT